MCEKGEGEAERDSLRGTHMGEDLAWPAERKGRWERDRGMREVQREGRLNWVTVRKGKERRSDETD